jgi:hypothetical protein
MDSNGPQGKRPESLISLLGFKAWLVGIFGVSFVFAFQGFYPDSIGPLSNFLPAVCAFAAFLSSLSCMRRYGFSLRSNFEAVWFLFTLGTGLWVFAEGFWAFYYFVLGIAVPYPSLADIFYIGGYFPMLAGLIGYLQTFRVALTKRRIGFAVCVIGAAVAIAMVFILPVELGQDLTAVGFLTDMIYPFLDMALLSLAVLSLAIFIGGSIAKWWMIFGVGAALYVIADEFFLYQVANGTYYNGSVDDLFFLLGYLTFALAFYAHRKEW